MHWNAVYFDRTSSARFLIQSWADVDMDGSSGTQSSLTGAAPSTVFE